MHKTITRWVIALRTPGKLLDRRLVMTSPRVRLPENVERDRQSILWSPNRRHSIELGIGNRSVKRILHQDPYIISCCPTVEIRGLCIEA